MEASALSAPAALRRPTWQPVRLLRLRSDEQLVALFRMGSEEAFGVIHERYRQRLFAYTRQMLAGSRQDAEDALQDVFLRAYAALRANERPVSLRAWLYRVAHNRCVDQLRRPVPLQADVFDVTRVPLHDPLAEAERRDDLRRLIGDVRRLPQAQRSALLMREMEGLTYEELAGALDTTVPAIKSLLVRARIGLVEAAEARDTDCVEIRDQLLAAYDKGVRASGQARRHMRECDGCREYRSALRGVQRSFAALGAPAAGPLALLAKLGLGGSSAAGGAAATGAAGGGGGVAGACMAGGGAAVVTAGKVVAVVCSVAVVTAGAAKEVTEHTTPAKTPAAHAQRATHGAAAHRAVPGAEMRAPARTDLIAGTVPGHRSEAAARRRAAKQHRHEAALADDGVELAPVPAHVLDDMTATDQTAVDPRVDSSVTGGAVAPDEPETPAGDTDAPATGSSGSSTTPGASTVGAVTQGGSPPPGGSAQSSGNNGSTTTSSSSSSSQTSPSSQSSGGGPK